MPSYRSPAKTIDGKIKLDKEIEWIVLNVEQTNQLADDAEQIANVIEEKKSYDGYTFQVKILRSMAKMIRKNNRVSAKQLATVQKSFYVTLGKELYVRGLEFYLIQNNEKMAKSMKIKKAREENEAKNKQE